jgi:hypothetical protein
LQLADFDLVASLVQSKFGMGSCVNYEGIHFTGVPKHSSSRNKVFDVKHSLFLYINTLHLPLEIVDILVRFDEADFNLSTFLRKFRQVLLSDERSELGLVVPFSVESLG